MTGCTLVIDYYIVLECSTMLGVKHHVTLNSNKCTVPEVCSREGVFSDRTRLNFPVKTCTNSC